MAQRADHFPNSLGIVFILILVDFQINVTRSIDFQNAKFRLTIICADQQKTLQQRKKTIETIRNWE